MECLSCRYELGGLTAGICPECGRAFDPTDRLSFGPLTRPRVGLGTVLLTVAALGWPMMLMLWAMTALLIARVYLGRWPENYRDDPKGIPVVGLMNVAWYFGILATFPIVGAGLVGAGWIAARRWRHGLLAFAAGVAFWFLAIALNRLTDVGTWMMD